MSQKVKDNKILQTICKTWRLWDDIERDRKQPQDERDKIILVQVAEKPTRTTI